MNEWKNSFVIVFVFTAIFVTAKNPVSITVLGWGHYRGHQRDFSNFYFSIQFFSIFSLEKNNEIKFLRLLFKNVYSFKAATAAYNIWNVDKGCKIAYK